MRCLEVTVNGERYCVAGANQIPMLSASVTHGGPEDAPDPDKTSLTIHGLSSDLVTDYYWGQQTFSLTAGDIVTIRLMDAPVADVPTLFPTDPLIAKYLERQRELEHWREKTNALYALARLHVHGEAPALKGLLLWGAITILGAALWVFSS